MREAATITPRKKQIYEAMSNKIINELAQLRSKFKEQRKNKVISKQDRDMALMIGRDQPIHRQVIMPTYHLDERLKVYREDKPPLDSKYMGIGYDGAVTDQKPSEAKRHYRKVFHDELENCPEIFKQSVFYNTPVMRG